MLKSNRPGCITFLVADANSRASGSSAVATSSLHSLLGTSRLLCCQIGTKSFALIVIKKAPKGRLKSIVIFNSQIYTAPEPLGSLAVQGSPAQSVAADKEGLGGAKYFIVTQIAANNT